MDKRRRFVLKFKTNIFSVQYESESFMNVGTSNASSKQQYWFYRSSLKDNDSSATEEKSSYILFFSKNCGIELCPFVFFLKTI